MNRSCPQCESRKTYVKDVSGRSEWEQYYIIMHHHCMQCRHEWLTEKEPYSNESKAI